jgi:CheY-like chemotaxis protein
MVNNPFFILLVDDDEDDTFMLIRALQTMGSTYGIQIVENGAEALVRLKEMKKEGKLPSLIVMDINMPKMDGKQTIVALQQNEDFAAVPIVILSTSSSAVDKLFFQRKNVKMISKPFDFEIFNKVALQLLSYCRP